MKTEHVTDRFYEELHHRGTDGVEVILVWRRTDGRTAVVVSDQRTGEAFAVGVEGRDALDAFYHPYSYAALRPSSEATEVTLQQVRRPSPSRT